MTVVLKTYGKGLADIWRVKKLLLFIYTINLIFACLLTLPVSMMFSEALVKTTAADKLLKIFDYPLYINIVKNYGQGISLSALLLPLGLFYLILNTFLAGGIIDLFVRQRKFNIYRFVQASLLYFGRFLKLFGLSLLMILAIVVLNGLLTKIAGLITEGAPTERVPLILLAVRLLIIFALLVFTNMLFDYAKIITVARESVRVVEAAILAWQFVWVGFIKTIGLYKLYLVTALLIMAIYWIIESQVRFSGPWMVLLFFLWTQFLMLMRIWVRLGFFAGQTIFYAGSAVAGISKPWTDEPFNEREIQP